MLRSVLPTLSYILYGSVSSSNVATILPVTDGFENQICRELTSFFGVWEYISGSNCCCAVNVWIKKYCIVLICLVCIKKSKFVTCYTIRAITLRWERYNKSSLQKKVKEYGDDSFSYIFYKNLKFQSV